MINKAKIAVNKIKKFSKITSKIKKSTLKIFSKLNFKNINFSKKSIEIEMKPKSKITFKILDIFILNFQI